MAIKHGLNLLLILCSLFTTVSLCASELVDPTRPPTRQTKTVPDNISAVLGAVVRSWKLESTLVASDRRVAVINGKLVSEGDSVDGARVIEIRKLDVLVQTSTRRLTLQLLPDIVKKIP